MKKKLINKLKQYGYDFQIPQDNVIKIKLSMSQTVTITFHNDNKISIEDKFEKWNYIGGNLNFNLKKLLKYYIILILLFVIFINFIRFLKFIPNSSSYNYIFQSDYIYFELLLILFSVWLGYIYYFIRFEIFKSTLIRWIDENDNK